MSVHLFLDSNILFSAAWSENSPANLLSSLEGAGFCRLTTSRLAWEEARRNIARKRESQLSRLMQLAEALEMGVEPDADATAIAAGHGLPDKDIPILAAAVAQRAELLVTGDRRDFGHLYGHTVATVRITNLPDAIEAVLAAKS